MKCPLILLPLLLVGATTLGQNCDHIELDYDKFSNNKEYYTPLFKPDSSPMLIYGLSAHKFISKGSYSYYLRASIPFSRPVYNYRGAVFILENGMKISKTSLKVDCDYQSVGKYSFSVYFKLTTSEVDLLRKYAVTDFKVGALREENIKYSGDFKGYFNCLTLKK